MRSQPYVACRDPNFIYDKGGLHPLGLFWTQGPAWLGGTLLMLLPPAPQRPSKTKTKDWASDRGRGYHKEGEDLLHHKPFSSKPKALIRSKRDSRGVTWASQGRVAKAPYELPGKLHSNTSPSVFSPHQSATFWLSHSKFELFKQITTKLMWG